MKRLPSILFILALAILFCGCTIDEYRTKRLLGNFPWELVPDYFPYEVGDTVIMKNNDEEVKFVVSSVVSEYEPYDPGKYKLLVCNCGTQNEYASKQVKLVKYDEDGVYFSMSWTCHRMEYGMSFAVGNQGINTYKGYNFKDKVESEDYNAMFALLPDTVESSKWCSSKGDSAKATIVKGIGIIHFWDAFYKQDWTVIDY
ncbi:MAG: hypothetical protein IJ650_00275 [Paludibacteraceae bacterium]|nr:hypothetical protein [Paludibacteraceae bacterium]